MSVVTIKVAQDRGCPVGPVRLENKPVPGEATRVFMCPQLNQRNGWLLVRMEEKIAILIYTN
jgi:hypothetical protein